MNEEIDWWYSSCPTRKSNLYGLVRVTRKGRDGKNKRLFNELNATRSVLWGMGKSKTQGS